MPAAPLAYLAVAVALIVAYFCGSIPVALIIGRLTRGVDVREHGSGNPGTTNAIRVLGTLPGVIVLLLDVAKAALACLIMRLIATQFTDWYAGQALDLLMLLAMFAAILGHMFSPFMRFKGGKGIAVALGGFLVILPISALVGLAVFAIVVLLTRLVSLGSMIAIISVPVATVFFYGASQVAVVFTIILAIVVVYAHRKNIARILNKQEPQISFHRKGQR